MKKLAMILGAGALMLCGSWAQDAPGATPAAVVQPAAANAVLDSTAAGETVPAADLDLQAKAGQPGQKALQPAPIDTWEAIVFCIVVVGVIFLGIWKSRDPKETEEEKKEKGASDYFLAGRGLTWWLVGFSLIAANISTEQFVGMSGQAADWLGLAIASYEWMAAITLVVVAFCFLPKLLRGGVYTIPEFLEYRYNIGARSIMAICTLLILVGVPTAGVIFAGAKVISVFFAGYHLAGIDFGNLTVGCIIIAFCASVYVYIGGLKACAWTDLIWGAGLIVGGGVVCYLVIQGIGSADPHHLIESASATSNATVDSLKNADAIDRFLQLNSGEAVDGVNSAGGKFHMIRPATDSAIPWTALCLGLWIPNFFYWGLNQYIMQRTLASKSLAEGQLGIIFAAFLKLLIPFVVVIPGILAYNLYRDDLRESAYSNQKEVIANIVNNGQKDKTVFFIDASVLMAAEPEAKEIKLRGEGTTTQIAFAEESILHNAKLVGMDPTNIEVAGENGAKTSINLVNALKTLRDDINNENTIKTERIRLIKPVVQANEVILQAAKDKKIETSKKIVGFDYDAAFPTLLKNLMPGTGLTWFVLAALFGAVVSSLASMLNSASTIFTMDIYNKLRKDATSSELVTVGKLGVLGCVLIATSLAPFLDNPIFGGIFTFIQEFLGYLSPGALCVFLFGFFVPKCPRIFGWLGIAINAAMYGALQYFWPSLPFLNRMSICFVTIVIIGFIFTIINASRGGEAIVLPAKNEVSLESSPKAKFFGWFVIAATVVLYAIFW